MKPPVIITDLDGCLVNLYQELQKFVWDIYSVWVPETAIQEYIVDTCMWRYIVEHPPRSVFVSKEQFKRVQKEQIEKDIHIFWSDPQGYLRAKPYWGYWHALLKWYWNGGRIHFVTARTQPVHEATISWLLSWGLLMGTDALNPPVRYLEGRERIEYVRTIRYHLGLQVYYIDDCRETCMEVVQSLKQEGVTVLMPERPWNCLPSDSDSDRICRLSDDQIAAVISVA